MTEPVTFMDAPASPSVTASGERNRVPPQATGYDTSVTYPSSSQPVLPQPQVGANTDLPRRSPAGSVRSHISTASLRERRRLQMEIRMAEIEKKKLEADYSLLSKRMELSMLEENDDDSQERMRNTDKVQSWLEDTMKEAPTHSEVPIRPPVDATTMRRDQETAPHAESARLKLPPKGVEFAQANPTSTPTHATGGVKEGRRIASTERQPEQRSTEEEVFYLRKINDELVERLRSLESQFKDEQRLKDEYMEGRRVSRSPTPRRSRERGMDRLAEAITEISKNRPPPRQAQELPIFSGAAVEWLPFKAAMRDSTIMFRYSRAENLARLRSCLRGEAKEAVAALLYTANDPEIIMQTLEQRFGRPETIIDRTLDELRKLPRPGVSAHELNVFAVKLQNLVCVLSTIDERGYLNNPLLTREVTSKLSPYLTARWCDFAEHYVDKKVPEIVVLSEFLMKEADRAIKYAFASTPATTTSRPAGPTQPAQSGRKPRNSTFTTNQASSDTGGKEEPSEGCLCCGGKHDVPRCNKYKQMSADDKWRWAREERICFQCVNSRHRRFKCKAKKCGVRGCQRAHHWSLHLDSRPSQPSSKDEPEGKAETVMAVSATSERREVLLKICPVILQGPTGKRVKTYALLDEGSTVTLIEEALATELGTKGPVRPMNLQTVGNTEYNANSRDVRLRIKGAARKATHPIYARTVPSLPAGSQTVNADCLRFRHLKGLKRRDVCYSGARARLIIGIDNWNLIVARKLLTGGRAEPIASLTDLGWIVHGVVPNVAERNSDERTMHITHCDADESVLTTLEENMNLHEAVERHFKVEALGVAATPARMPAADQRAVDLFKATIGTTDGGYEVGLPWKWNNVVMPPSREMALRRLSNIEKKMERNESFEHSYKAEMNNLITKGYATKCTGDEMESPHAWWLPHFAVTNLNKPGKIRLVFDAAAISNGVCLNDALLEGPDLLRSLPGVLFRFREERVAVAGDIQEMFLRIKIRPEDQPAQMFVWRNEAGQPPENYKMESMIFGARSSPFLAHSVRNFNAERHKDEFPRAYEAITKNHYMDDWLDSYTTTDEARAVVAEVRAVHAMASFNMRGWASNEDEALKDVPRELKAEVKRLGQSVLENTLGLRWHAATDELHFNTVLPKVSSEVKQRERPPTKREALSMVMSIFDPLGLASYFTIRAKILLQELWRLKLDWDEAVPDDFAQEWDKWVEEIEKLDGSPLRRCYATGGAVKKELHVFCDASTEASAAAAYWRITGKSGAVEVTLTAAKARVAPLRAQSVPRMELQAALIGARLATTIKAEHRWQADRTIYWTDSRTVLAWIRSEHLKLTPFVAHRVNEIAEMTNPKDWRWVPTCDNVADDATRHNGTIKGSQDRWYVGPDFLYEPEASWPKEENSEAVATETVLSIKIEENGALPRLERFSKYERLIRATAYVLVFIDACRKRTKKLKLRHIQRAEQTWFREVQKASFSEEIAQLKKGGEISKSSKIRTLDPILDEEGVLRLRGRIGAANVTEEMKRPIILDGRHPFTKLLVAREHEKAGHSGNERVVNDLRQRYWIIHLRPTVRQAAKSCQECRIRRATPSIPPHGDLPSARLQPFARPFTYTGIDYFGPIVVTVGRRHEKRWGALFTCLTTRAIHLEIAHSLSTESAVMALRRMAARRGWPKVLYSDNGTNFKGADNDLRAAYAEWLPQLRDVATLQRTEWRFIPPGAPNQGGAWERLVRSVKTALSAVLREKNPRDEVLQTVFAEAEHTVNGRPLTHVPVSPNDPEALTPNHFLIGSSSGLPATGPCEHANRHTWRASQALADEFWRRWLREYLPTLTPRGNASDRRDNLQPGDLVIVVDSSLPRNTWPRGQVERTFPGPDGKVRSADVRTASGVFRRPVRRLAVLPVERDGSEGLRRGENVTDGAAGDDAV